MLSGMLQPMLTYVRLTKITMAQDGKSQCNMTGPCNGGSLFHLMIQVTMAI